MRNGAGTYNLPAGNPVVTGTTISSTWANNTLSDMASALTQSVAKDGQTVMTNNLPMGGFKLTNLAAGSNAGDSVRYQQLFSQGLPTDIASAATTDIGGQNTAFLNVTGTVGITSFGTNYNGPRILTFAASLTLTHDATALILPLGQNIITKAGDVAIAVPKSTLSGTPDGWKVVSYMRYNNMPLVNDMQTIASASTLDFTATQAQLYSISGTTDVTAATMYEAQPVFAIATGAFKLVNSTSLIVEGGADYTCKLNDILIFIKDDSGNVHVCILNINIKQIQSISTSVSANALTLNYAGGTLDFRNGTLANGTPISGVSVPALSITIPSGATLGTTNAIAARLVLLVAYNAGTPVLCVTNLAGGLSLVESNLISPTTISGSSNSNNVIYSSASVASNSQYRVIGFVDSTQTTAGTWAVVPTLAQGGGGQSLTSIYGIGCGQTWQDVTGSRITGAPYTNDTGRTITISAYSSAAAANAGISIVVNGAVIANNAFALGSASAVAFVSAIVPPGATYSRTDTGIAAKHYELR